MTAEFPFGPISVLIKAFRGDKTITPSIAAKAALDVLEYLRVAFLGEGTPPPVGAVFTSMADAEIAAKLEECLVVNAGNPQEVEGPVLTLLVTLGPIIGQALLRWLFSKKA